jgi:hypothetical protein
LSGASINEIAPMAPNQMNGIAICKILKTISFILPQSAQSVNKCVLCALCGYLLRFG